MRNIARLRLSVLAMAVAAAAAVSGLAWSMATGPAPQSPLPAKPNILVITIDTMRADHLGCYGYFRETSPHIDALAKESIVFENCNAPMAQTLPTHTSLFTSVYPREHGIVANIAQTGGMYKPSPVLQTFATAIGKQGYATAGFVSAEPVKKIGGIAAGFAKWYEPDDKKVEADWTNRKIFEWIDAGGLKEPFFMWVHYFDPHAKYEPPAPYDTMFTDDEKLDKYMTDRAFGMEAGKERAGKENHTKIKKSKESINLYDGEVRWTDENIGKLFAKLKEKGVWDKTVIVLTGDHGEGLGQHNLTGHGNIWGEQLHVPLLIHVPGQAPRRVATRVTSPDILPTVLALVPSIPGADFLKQASGVNVLAPNLDANRPLYAQLPGSRTVMVHALTLGDWRFIRHPAKGDMLFNLKDDPFELHNLADKSADRASQMREELQKVAIAQSANGKKNKAGEVIKPEDNEAVKAAVNNLKAFGYVEGGSEADEEGADSEGVEGDAASGKALKGQGYTDDDEEESAKSKKPAKDKKDKKDKEE